MNVKFQKYLDLAFSLYEDSSEIRCQHFCMATYKNRIVSVGKNSKKTTPINLFNPTFDRNGENISGIRGSCAEFGCLRKIKQTTNIPFNKIVLYVIRIDRNKKVAYSRPCKSCESLLRWLEVKNIYYTNNEGNFEQYGC